MGFSDQTKYAAKLTGVFFGTFLVVLLVSAVSGFAAPGELASFFFINTLMVLGIFFYFTAPVLFVIAFAKPEWFGLVDFNQAMRRFGIFWLAGLAGVCVLLFLVGSQLTLPDFGSINGPLTVGVMFLVVNTVMLGWISPLYIWRGQAVRRVVLALVAALTLLDLIVAVM